MFKTPLRRLTNHDFEALAVGYDHIDRTTSNHQQKNLGTWQIQILAESPLGTFNNIWNQFGCLDRHFWTEHGKHVTPPAAKHGKPPSKHPTISQNREMNWEKHVFHQQLKRQQRRRWVQPTRHIVGFSMWLGAGGLNFSRHHTQPSLCRCPAHSNLQHGKTSLAIFASRQWHIRKTL